MNRHVRSWVECVIGGWKEFAGLNSVRARKEPGSDPNFVLTAVALATVAVRGHRVGKPSLTRSPVRVM